MVYYNRFDRWSAYKTIRFNVRQDNLLLLWRNSYLELKGQVVQKANGNAFADNASIALIHNAIPHMYSNVKLTIGNQMVENVDHIGHVSSMMYDVLYPRSKGKSNLDGSAQYYAIETSYAALK